MSLVSLPEYRIRPGDTRRKRARVAFSGVKCAIIVGGYPLGTAGRRRAAIASAATMLLIFLFAKDLFDSLAGGIAAAAYSLLAVRSSVLGTAAHATHFVPLFAVAASWALWRALWSDKGYLLFISGVLFGTAFLAAKAIQARAGKQPRNARSPQGGGLLAARSP